MIENACGRIALSGLGGGRIPSRGRGELVIGGGSVFLLWRRGTVEHDKVNEEPYPNVRGSLLRPLGGEAFC